MGVVLLFVVSELLGIFMGGWFFRLFLKTIPPLALSSFSEGTARFAFIFYGLVCGVAVFLWCLAAVALSRFFSVPARAGGSNRGR